MSETVGRALAEFAAGLQFDDIPAKVRDAARLHVVDSVGVCIAGASPQEESGAAMRKLAELWKAPSGASLIGIWSQSRPEMAALVNGSLAQALEMDDKHGSSLARPGSTVVPAVLAVAEDRDLPFQDVIVAIVAGYEVMIRLGFVAGERFLERGYHTSSLLGGFGAAAAVGRLLNCSADQILDALGVCGTTASGIQEATRTGSTSKILHGGWGAHSGIIALDLASAGITGPESVFEGGFGFFQTHLTPIKGDLDWAKATEELGSRWFLPETAFKPYPCCQLLHAFIEAAKQTLVEFAQDGVGVEQIDSIECRLAEPGLTLVTEPKERKKAPTLPHEARFSLPFVVATALIHGDVGVDSFREDRLLDPAIRRLAQRVEWAEDPDSDYPLHCPAILEVHAAGKVYRKHVPYHPGSPETPLSFDDVVDKFARNTAWSFGDKGRGLAEWLSRLADDASLRVAFGELAEAGAGVPQRKAVGAP